MNSLSEVGHDNSCSESFPLPFIAVSFWPYS